MVEGHDLYTHKDTPWPPLWGQRLHYFLGGVLGQHLQAFSGTDRIGYPGLYKGVAQATS